MTCEGVHLDHKDLEAGQLLKDREPKNVRIVRDLTDFLSYCRSLIQDFSWIARPLFKLMESRSESSQRATPVRSNKTKSKTTKSGQLTSKTPMHWTPEHSTVVLCLIDMLTSPLILANPENYLPFVLYTNASDGGLGDLLYQQQGKKLHVITYGSRTLTPAQKTYYLHSTKHDFLALK